MFPQEISDIADPQDTDGTVFRGHMHFAFENIDGFIPAEEPAEFPAVQSHMAVLEARSPLLE